MNNDVIMKKTFLPKTIRWTFYSGFVFLIIMSLLRFVFANYFSAPASTDNNLTSSYILGFRYDLRYVTIVMMITLLFSYIKPLNPFDKKLGKQCLCAPKTQCEYLKLYRQPTYLNANDVAVLFYHYYHYYFFSG